MTLQDWSDVVTELMNISMEELIVIEITQEHDLYPLLKGGGYYLDEKLKKIYFYGDL